MLDNCDHKGLEDIPDPGGKDRESYFYLIKDVEPQV